MRLRPAFATACLIGALAAGSARADNYPVRDGTGTSRTFASKTSGGVEYPQNMSVGVAFLPSGVSPVSGTLTTTGQSGAMTPLAGRRFNGSFTVTGAASLQLERQLGGTWFPVSTASLQAIAWQTTGTMTVNVSVPLTEDQNGVPYRWNVTACSSCSVSYRLEQ